MQQNSNKVGQGYIGFNRPNSAAPVARPALKMVMQNVNCNALMRFQHKCMASANTPILINVSRVQNSAINPVMYRWLVHIEVVQASVSIMLPSATNPP